jgi:hypothetical protein
MSGSPKYTTVVSDAERRRRAEAERKRREAQRAEKERKRRERALADAQRTARRRIDQLTDRVRGLHGAAESTGHAQVSNAIQATLRTVAADVLAATDESGVRAATRRLSTLDGDLMRLQAQVIAEQRARDERQATARQEAERRAAAQRAAEQHLAEIVALVDTVAAAERGAYDAAGAAEVATAVDRVRGLVAADPVGALTAVAGVTDRVRQHLDTVVGARTEHEARFGAAQQTVAALAGALGPLSADAQEAGVAFADGPRCETAVSALAAALERGDVGYVETYAGAVQATIDEARQSVDRAIDGLVERRDLARAIMGALGEFGYHVNPDSLVETGDGALGLLATRSDGEDVGVLVHTGGDGATRVEYTTSGTLRAGEDDVPAADCDPLVELINLVGAETAKAGFVTGGVEWHGGDGPRRVGVQLPQQHGQQRTVGS